jgi:hypothetical protein
MDERTNNLPVSDGLDGYADDDAGSSLIKGTKLKFSNDFEWMAGDDTVIAGDREFLVVEIVKAVQKWIDQRPVETRVLGANEKFPDMDELNAAAPREEWTEKFGKEVGPWDKCYVVYLLDPATMRIYSYPTNTNGGGHAVRELRETTRMARRLHGQNLYPRVRLGDVHMNTQFGGRQRPFFDIVRYEMLGSERATLTAVEPKQIEAKPVEEAKPAEEAKPKPTGKSGKTAQHVRF